MHSPDVHSNSSFLHLEKLGVDGTSGVVTEAAYGIGQKHKQVSIMISDKLHAHLP